MDKLIGTLIGNKYLLTQKLGEGGLGQVFLATHTQLSRQVALKLLHPELSSDKGLILRFEREARAASMVNHPNSVMIYDFGEDWVGTQKQYYLVMEYLQGETLHDRIQDHPQRRLPVWEAVHILAQVLRALAAFHKVGVIHRDIKPDNIMLCRNESGEAVKLLDFGIAKTNGMSLTATGQMVGTPHYMSPEQIRAKKDLGPEVDIYAVGVLLYEALTGDTPYQAEHQMDLFRMHLQDEVPSLGKKYPKERHLLPLDAVIRKAMAKKPSERYQTAEEMRQSMEAALVSCVAQEQEALELTQARKKLTPSWWLEQQNTTQLKREDLSEESSTANFPISSAKTISLPSLSVEETVKMPRLEVEMGWDYSDHNLSTVPEVAPMLRPHPSWAKRASSLWKKLGNFWQFFGK